VGRTYTPKQRRGFTDANREAWDEVAPIHEKINQSRLLDAFSDPEYNTLDDHCLDRLKEIGIDGKSIAQLCCNNGRELLSLKNLGAGRCVGFDASAAFVEQALELAKASGHTGVEFVATDIYEIPPDHAGPYDTLADITMAAIEEGFVLKHFSEFGCNISELCADLEHAEARPPMGMTMVWQKGCR
jgi:hypothetical protein